MVNKGYRKGYANERKTIKHLETMGYSTMRSAGSHGPWDVIGIDSASIKLIQVKSNRKPSKVEEETMAGYPVPSNCTKEVWIWHDWESFPETYRIE